MDNRTGLEAQMAKHIHFIYIGRPPDNKDPNLILGCLDIIDVELLRLNSSPTLEPTQVDYI